MVNANSISTIALIGNPNSGKSTLFNELTGLNQRVSNYPGVTVEKKSGKLQLDSGQAVQVIDFPGIYSLYPNSHEERLVVETLTNPTDANYPDLIVYVAAAVELEKHFLLATQLKELGIPMLFCLTMSDIAIQKGIKYDTDVLQQYLKCPIVEISVVSGNNLNTLKVQLQNLIDNSHTINVGTDTQPTSKEEELIAVVGKYIPSDNAYRSLLIGHHYKWLTHITPEERQSISNQLINVDYSSTRLQVKETMGRYDRFTPIIKRAEVKTKSSTSTLGVKVDNILTHQVSGPLIFLLIIFLIFQSIYAWSEAPMSWIENAFTFLSTTMRDILPAGTFTDLLTDGIIAGLGGVVIFIPQITILFLIIAILEESGYMSRAVFMFDGIMQRFGLSGRSIVALVSSGACAIPAIMSTRTIANWKERLITILVSPLISCSARLPVYAILIGFVVPSSTVMGIFNMQGIAFMGLYLLGIIAALLMALFFKYILRSEEPSYLIIELPDYKRPRIKNILLYVKEKVMSFIIGAGQIILIISIALWFLASYGMPKKMQQAEAKAVEVSQIQNLDSDTSEDLIASYRLEASFAGQMGKWIEPAIAPLGYDWKMGIALITSFAAREVFVGTMATIYSVGSTDDESTIRQKMAAEVNPATGLPRYDLPTSLSLLLFYVFAMQCMSTLAVTKRETNSWKWPLIQFGFMSGLAYMSSLLVFQCLS